MQIPIATWCLPQHIDSAVVGRFRDCGRADKDSALRDAMTLWELIKDCFNNFNHYKALSNLFDLVQIEKANNAPDIWWDRRLRLLTRFSCIEREMKDLIHSDFDVQHWVKWDIDRPYIAFGFFVAHDYEAWVDQGSEGNPPALLTFSMTLIDHPRIIPVWNDLRRRVDLDRFPQAVSGLNAVLDDTNPFEERYMQFLQLAELGSAEDRKLFEVFVSEPDERSQTLKADLVYNKVLLASGSVLLNTDFALRLQRLTKKTEP